MLRITEVEKERFEKEDIVSKCKRRAIPFCDVGCSYESTCLSHSVNQYIYMKNLANSQKEAKRRSKLQSKMPKPLQPLPQYRPNPGAEEEAFWENFAKKVAKMNPVVEQDEENSQQTTDKVQQINTPGGGVRWADNRENSKAAVSTVTKTKKIKMKKGKGKGGKGGEPGMTYFKPQAMSKELMLLTKHRQSIPKPTAPPKYPPIRDDLEYVSNDRYKRISPELLQLVGGTFAADGDKPKPIPRYPIPRDTTVTLDMVNPLFANYLRNVMEYEGDLNGIYDIDFYKKFEYEDHSPLRYVQTDKIVYMLNKLLAGGTLDEAQLKYLMYFLKSTADLGPKKLAEYLKMLQRHNVLKPRMLNYLSRLLLQAGPYVTTEQMNRLFSAFEELNEEVKQSNEIEEKSKPKKNEKQYTPLYPNQDELLSMYYQLMIRCDPHEAKKSDDESKTRKLPKDCTCASKSFVKNY